MFLFKLWVTEGINSKKNILIFVIDSSFSHINFKKHSIHDTLQDLYFNSINLTESKKEIQIVIEYELLNIINY